MPQLTATARARAAQGLRHWRRGALLTARSASPLYPADGSDAGRALKDADLALYAAKDGGRRASPILPRDMREAVEQRIALRDEVRRSAPCATQIVPLLSAQDRPGTASGRRLRGAGCAGSIPSAAPGARRVRSGVRGRRSSSTAIGEVMLHRAPSRQTCRLAGRGITCGRVAVNLSSSPFAHPNFAEQILDKLARRRHSAGLPRDRGHGKRPAGRGARRRGALQRPARQRA